MRPSATATDLWRGWYFEELEVGQRFDCGRITVTESQIAESCQLTGDFNPLQAGEKTETRAVRFRTVGDMTLTGCVESEASTVAEIIDEIAVARITERGATRGDDRFSEAAMEDRKREGYF